MMMFRLSACLLVFLSSHAYAQSQPNVLFIAVDDLRAELGCYGASHVQSPNIDALAMSGRRFERAYCQQSVCNPSRSSLMTGLRPDSVGVTGNHVHFRSKHADVVTLPEYFRQHGYHTQSIGKIYHGVFPAGSSNTKWDTMGDPQSWSVPTTRFGPRYYYTEEGIEAAKETYLKVYRPKNPAPDDWTKKLVFGPMTEAPDVDDETLYDGKVAAAAVKTLQSLGKQEKPFFLAVGFIKPHSPAVAAKKYWDRYDADKIQLAEQTKLPTDAPAMAGHNSHEIRRYTDQPNTGPISAANQRRIKHGYYACISMVDTYIGKVLAELNAQGLAENTIVVLFSDHGYHLGEQGLWGKTTNFELDTRVPLIIRAPGMNLPGESTRSLAELVDLYPTLAELAGLPIPQQLEGTSLASVLADPNAAPDDIATSQYPRLGNADHGGKIMGYSLRSDRYRYTEWIDRETHSTVARELYEYANDDVVETQNLANNDRYVTQVGELSQRLRQEIAPSASVQALPVRSVVFQRSGQFGYRIPAVATTNKGTILAFAERRIGLNDHAMNDIVLKRSLDQGASWQAEQVLVDEGGDSLNDPCVVVLKSGRILLRYTRFPEGVHSRNSGHTVIAEPGYGGPKNVRLYLMHSDDDGVTWSDPREVTESFRREQAISVGSPGRAIQLQGGKHAGRIVFPMYEMDHLGDNKRKSFNAVVYSDDDGKTWTLSPRIEEGDLPGGGNEAQLVELANHDILITSRDHLGGSRRKISTSSDGGATWAKMRLADELVTPACMGGIARISPVQDRHTAPGENQSSGEESWLVHSLPHTTSKRANGTLFISEDEGATWRRSLVIEPGAFAYSCLATLNHGDLGCLFEAGGYKTIEFTRIPLRRLSQRPLRIACVGDSITFGTGISDRAKASYPAQLQKLLGDRYLVQNFGVPGASVLKDATRDNGWKRWYGGHPPHEQAIAFEPNIVVMNLGINDIAHWDELGAKFTADYYALIETYRKLPTKPKVYVWHPLAPLFKGQRFFGDPNLVKLNAAIASAAKKAGVQTIDLATPLQDQPTWFPDHIHPNASGARKIAETVALAIAPGVEIPVAPQPMKVMLGLATSFEECAEGNFKTMASNVGVWTTTAGEAEIDPAHQHSGKNCLHLFGGTKCEVELAVDISKPINAVTFHAERWTRRTPFSFHVDRFDGDKWSEIYDGSAVVPIGKFPVKVSIPLKSTPKRLRFRCTSPPKTGVMIDDLTFVTPTKQKITNVSVEAVQTPVLVGLKQNPLLRIRVDTEGSLEPLSILSVAGSLNGTIRNEDLASLQLFASNDSLQLKEGVTAVTAPGAIGDYRFEPKHELVSGVNYFWLSCALRDKANIDATIEATCKALKFSNGQTVTPVVSTATHRLGVAVRRHMQDGVHTCRIPGLATTKKGTLIGVYDLRNRAGGDLPGDIDVGMSRSTDGGQTWEPFKRIMDMGDDAAWRYDGIGDPAVLVDENTGTIWVAATWSHGNRSWFGSGPGLKPEETGQFMLCRSDDDGVSWSKPINITKQVKKPEWCFLLQGPGKGITMRDGTIVFAAQYQDTPENKRLPRSTIIYSKDHGETWQVGTGAFDDTTEAQVVELEPGVLMLNCRYNRASVRVVMVTRDMGKTWKKHSTSQRALIEPRSCMASLINVDQEVGKDFGGWLLFSNPNSTAGRNHITIKGSSDAGETWPEQHRLLLDEGNGRGYSCMTMIGDKHVGILYESSRADMAFQRIPLSVLFEKKEPVKRASDDKTSLKLPQVFGDHMVLQADAELPVWGTSAAGASVTVMLDGKVQHAKADPAGKWQVRLPARKASSQPVSLTVTSGAQKIVINDILVGEVWVCAGQSNMEWPLRQSTHGKEELSAADHPQIRLLNLVPGARGSSGHYQQQHLDRLEPDKFCIGEWQVASSNSAASFSAVAWYFGRHLQRELDTPVGLICPAVGGTPAEAWVPRDALQADSKLNALVAGNWLDNDLLGNFCRERGLSNLLPAIQAGKTIPTDEYGPNHSYKPGFMWEAGIAPLVPYAIRGAIWYQGESNAETPSRIVQHELIFPLLVKQWRANWRQGDFPFLWVQLPALNREHWPLFRDQQRRMMETIPNTGMAITIDSGHPTNVHPTLKKPVGERLALWALGDVYKRSEDKPFSGPLQTKKTVESDSIRITFEHAGEGLATTDGKPPRHFEVAGNNGVFHPADAKIDAKNSVVVTSQAVSQPTEVRYVWRPYPEPPVNLVNSASLPASPFSTAPNSQPISQLPDARPNILLIVGEDHGCELSCYGDPVIQTPHLDRLAEQGVLFQNGYVTQSVCSPSRSSIFTGLYPHQNGQLGLATHSFGWFQRWPTTYSLLKGAGYRTGLIGKTHINPASAVEDFVDFRFQPTANFAKKNVAQYAVKAGEFFSAGDAPFFMTVNYPDAHWPLQGKVDGLPETQVNADDVQVMPYVGGETPRLKKVVQNYYDCMLRLDACVGQLLLELDKSGKAKNTLVVFIGDHGAQMARGKVTVYEGGMRVPFMIRWPGKIQPKQRSTALVSTIDLLPTFTDCAQLSAPIGLPGKSLLKAIEPAALKEFRKYLVCERNCDAAHISFPQRTIRDARYKLIYSPMHDREDPAARYYRIHGASHWAGCLTDKELEKASERTQAGYERWLHPPEFQLYDLKADPHEWHDLASDPKYSEIKERLRSSLKTWQQGTDDYLLNHEKLTQLMAETDALNAKKKRSPDAGWQYLKYLQPNGSSTEDAISN